MRLDEQAQQWRDSTENAITNIERLVYGPKEDYEQEFQMLALAITNTDKNPWSFMPKGWEGVRDDAQQYESFLTMVHHALCDDGDISFVEHKMHGQCIVMYNHNDTDLIKEQMAKRYPDYPNRSNRLDNAIPYTVHTDVWRFIRSIQSTQD